MATTEHWQPTGQEPGRDRGIRHAQTPTGFHRGRHVPLLQQPSVHLHQEEHVRTINWWHPSPAVGHRRQLQSQVSQLQEEPHIPQGGFRVQPGHQAGGQDQRMAVRLRPRHTGAHRIGW